jgi:hypothetical protein
MEPVKSKKRKLNLEVCPPSAEATVEIDLAANSTSLSDLDLAEIAAYGVLMMPGKTRSC